MIKNNIFIERLDNFSSSLPNKIDLSLNRVERLLKKIGNPHLQLPPFIHVAGTNGKGSTIQFISSILQSAGKLLHIYTSPHLINFNERLIISNKLVSNKNLSVALDYCIKKNNSNPITQFELLTCMSFYLMSKNKADYVIVETGLGGRLDATNVHPSPILSILTNISYDHESFLGNTIGKIAKEKAGIIKKGVPCVSTKQFKAAIKSIENTAHKKKSKLFICGKHWNYKIKADGFNIYSGKEEFFYPFPSRMLGEHQIENAALAIYSLKLIKSLKLKNKNIVEGLKTANWHGRLEKIRKGKFNNIVPEGYEIWLDGGHNILAAQVIKKWIKLRRKDKNINKIILVCNFLKNKNAEQILKILKSQIDEVVFLDLSNLKNFYSIKSLKDIADKFDIKNSHYSSVERALKNVQKKDSGYIIIFGSLYLVGEVVKENIKYAD